MTDYIPSEIVQYFDLNHEDIVTFASDVDTSGFYYRGVLGPYPSTLEPSYVRIEEVNITTPWYYPISVPSSALKELVSQGFLDSELYEEHKNDFVFLQCIRDVSNNQYVADVSYQLYYLPNWEFKYYRVGIYAYTLPDFYHPDLSGTDVFWLYNFGNYIFLQIDSFTSLFDISIGGYNLLYLLCGSGFIVYIGWAIIKWVIPV